VGGVGGGGRGQEGPQNIRCHCFRQERLPIATR